MKTIPRLRSNKNASPKTETISSNCKWSRLMTKSDSEILLEILVLVEKVGSFCPEILMQSGRKRIFEEAYRRFETWDEIVEKSVMFSNEQILTLRFQSHPFEGVILVA